MGPRARELCPLGCRGQQLAQAASPETWRPLKAQSDFKKKKERKKRSVSERTQIVSNYRLRDDFRSLTLNARLCAGNNHFYVPILDLNRRSDTGPRVEHTGHRGARLGRVSRGRSNIVLRRSVWPVADKRVTPGDLW